MSIGKNMDTLISVRECTFPGLRYIITTTVKAMVFVSSLLV